MTGKNSESVEAAATDDVARSSMDPATADPDQVMHDFEYGHGRMPFFMKLVWVGFLSLATWYIVANLLSALETELG